MNYETSFLHTYADEEQLAPTISQIVDHIRYIARLGGTECIGLGSDFDGIMTNDSIPNAGALPMLEDALWEAGFSQSEIEGIFYKNVLRVYRDNF